MSIRRTKNRCVKFQSQLAKEGLSIFNNIPDEGAYDIFQGEYHLDPFLNF